MKRGWLAAFTAAIGLIGIGAAHAQFPGPPPGGGFHGPPGGGPMGRPVMAADVPVRVLAAELRLTPGQKSRIAAIEDSVRRRRSTLMPPGPRQNPQSMPNVFGQMRAADQAASAQVEAVLTSPQRSQIRALLTSLSAARSAGIPFEVYPDLKLTPAQKGRIAALAAANRRSMQAAFANARQGGFEAMRSALDGVRASSQAKLKTILTPRQSAILAAYLRSHPRRQFGGPMGGGPGMPPPGGGFGGPPPGGGPMGGPPPGPR